MSGACFPLNLWYQAGWSEEIAAGGSLARTFAEIPVLLYRKSDGSLAAVHDRCPHRFAPLSQGCVENDMVRCGYHGLAFGPDGQCVENPHGPLTKIMRVASYPVVERHDAIWVWLGDPQQADPDQIRDLSFIDETAETAKFRGYLPTKANYQLLNDNILDLTHATWVHANSIGGILYPQTVMAVEETAEKVTVSWTSKAAPASPLFAASVGESIETDQRTEVIWSKPGVMVLDATEVPAGVPVQPENHVIALHSMTPETATTSHYFYCGTRGFNGGDGDATKMLKTLADKAFIEEDKPMIEGAQKRMGDADFWALKPLLLPIDKAAVLARRKIEKLIAAESGN